MKPLLDYRPALVNGQGIGRYVRELTRSLVALSEVDLALFAPTWARSEFAVESLGIERARLFRRTLPSKAVTRSLSALGLGVERLFRGGADLCHHTQYRRLPTRLPSVAMIHDLVFLDDERFMASATASRMSEFARWAASECAAITTPSETVADEVACRLDVPRERVFATPLGVDHALPGPLVAEGAAWEAAGEAAGTPYFFTAARIETRKNLGVVLRAFEQLDIPGVRWKIAGIRGDGAEVFEEALRRSPARDAIDLLGHVSESALRDLTMGAIAFVLVPLDEGFGLAPLEAMAMGTPAVSSRVPVVEEVCGGGAVLVNPSDEAALAIELRRLAAEPGVRDERARLGYEHAARFTWSVTAERTLDAYRFALSL
ncbi:GDP-mannose:cellobiosyl-diphosphopolyprenol alpha-mannosyltransferase [Planctomycetes bacterium Poly30]|uniref:GDP-mannose:cellobiosyl-diphosphopolyprenol alpha-mannosyltransferase n=1 Tax=Saltatorellus ferox TaxID=2528018 RepID=A0A518ERV7_9BACT|nr:GDP-mannose:cellobiosyl-diphosphopolyprenol alpha-mannosyltransferase [Planctomycetes bacterium Poly30]